MSLPNRIDYIVAHRRAAIQALNQSWPLAQEAAGSLSTQTKARVREHGKAYIEELLKLHPDKAAVLAAAGHDDAYDGFCGCGSSVSSYTGTDAEAQLKELVGIIRDEYQDSGLLEKLRSYTDAVGAAPSTQPGTNRHITIPSSWLWLGGMLLTGFVVGALCKGGKA